MQQNIKRKLADVIFILLKIKTLQSYNLRIEKVQIAESLANIADKLL